jgi:hypothetical protein
VGRAILKWHSVLAASFNGNERGGVSENGDPCDLVARLVLASHTDADLTVDDLDFDEAMGACESVHPFNTPFTPGPPHASLSDTLGRASLTVRRRPVVDVKLPARSIRTVETDHQSQRTLLGLRDCVPRLVVHYQHRPRTNVQRDMVQRRGDRGGVVLVDLDNLSVQLAQEDFISQRRTW